MRAEDMIAVAGYLRRKVIRIRNMEWPAEDRKAVYEKTNNLIDAAHALELAAVREKDELKTE